MTETWMQVETIPTVTLQDFAAANGLTLTVTERRVAEDDPMRFYARFRNADVMENGMLVGTYGNGATPDEAAADYAHRISLRRIAIEAYAESRREIAVPRLTHDTP